MDVVGYTGSQLLYVSFVVRPSVRCEQCWENVDVVIGQFADSYPKDCGDLCFSTGILRGRLAARSFVVENVATSVIFSPKR